MSQQITVPALHCGAYVYQSVLCCVAVECCANVSSVTAGKLKDLGNSLLGKFGMSLDNFKAEQDPATGGYSIKFVQ
jgi:hypothetical protein